MNSANDLFNQKITAVIAQALAQLSCDDPQEYARRLALGPGVYAQPQADCVRFTWHGPLAEVDLSLLTDDSIGVDDMPAPVWLPSCPDDIGELDED
ncbi:hypothetical protein GV792_07790 [Nocardia cyriacigeorgica]|uniref:hypothetical protein n=1 Tax=Nocardia cyriacigeorgica TaxID=135487 RepID=UPI0013B92BA6|nr:hypothetical protein [Nocardia cyriacigeorgica]NEW49954.1 hypothetical protein [Nocardia cyriacigeorgica]